MIQDHQEEMMLMVSLVQKKHMDLTACQYYLASGRQKRPLKDGCIGIHKLPGDKGAPVSKKPKALLGHKKDNDILKTCILIFRFHIWPS